MSSTKAPNTASHFVFDFFLIFFNFLETLNPCDTSHPDQDGGEMIV